MHHTSITIYRVENEIVELEDIGVNESVVNGLHEEVVELMEATTAPVTMHGTIMPYCTCGVKSTCQTARCPCKASQCGCNATRCKCNGRISKNQMEKASTCNILLYMYTDTFKCHHITGISGHQ